MSGAAGGCAAADAVITHNVMAAPLDDTTAVIVGWEAAVCRLDPFAGLTGALGMAVDCKCSHVFTPCELTPVSKLLPTARLLFLVLPAGWQAKQSWRRREMRPRVWRLRSSGG